MGRSIEDLEAESRILRPEIFVDRNSVLHAVSRLTRGDDGPRIIFLKGIGGQGKTSVLRFVQQYALKQFDPEQYRYILASTDAAEAMRTLRAVAPLPSVYVSFGVEHSAEDNPRDPVRGLLLIAHRLGRFGLRFPYFYYGLLVYRQTLGYTDARTIADLVPDSEIGLLQQIIGLLSTTSRWIGLATSLTKVIGARTSWDPTRTAKRRRLDVAVVAQIEERTEPYEVLQILPRLLANDLNAYQDEGVITLIFDGYEQLTSNTGRSPGETEDSDWWIRQLLRNVDRDQVAIVAAGREMPPWANAEKWPIPENYVRQVDLPPLEVIDAARIGPHHGIPAVDWESFLRSVSPATRGHPLSLVTEANILAMPDHPAARQAGGPVLNRLLNALDPEDRRLLTALCAARTFDIPLAVDLGSRLAILTSEARIERLCALAVVVPADNGVARFAVHDLLRDCVGQTDPLVQRAHQALAQCYRQLAAGPDGHRYIDDVIYHQYWVEELRPESLTLWAETMAAAIDELDWPLTRSILTLERDFSRSGRALPAPVLLQLVKAYHGLGMIAEARATMGSLSTVDPISDLPTELETELWRGFLEPDPGRRRAHFKAAALNGRNQLASSTADPRLVQHLIARSLHMAASRCGSTRSPCTWRARPRTGTGEPHKAPVRASGNGATSRVA